MSNKKETAVEYLVEQLIPKALSMEQYYHIRQAKELEKQQIIEAHDNGYIDGGNKNKVTAEQYYKETYEQ